VDEVVLHLTSRAETNWRGRRELLKSGMLFWRSSRALLMATSISEGELREGLFAAILECWDMAAAVVVEKSKLSWTSREIERVWEICAWA